MPKCLKVTLSQVADWENLIDASHKAAKGKRNQIEVQRFFSHFEESIQQLQNSIMDARLIYAGYRAFSIKDPKPRIIHAAPFADRVLHHALINCIGARLEKSWVKSSYACRKNYGAHRAIEKAASLAQEHSVIIKLDIRAYFAYIQHNTLIKLVGRQLKGDGLFKLLTNILHSFNQNGVGIPIGALTSQYFANHYLDGFQRWLRTLKAVKEEVRYMDDVLVFCHSLSDARKIALLSKQWLADERGLILKPPIIQLSHIGVLFCGFKISSKSIKLGKRRKRSYRSQLKLLFKKVEAGNIEPANAQRQANNLASLCLPGQHKNWQIQQLKLLRSDAWKIEI